MNSREKILAAVRANKPGPSPLPAIAMFDRPEMDRQAHFAETLAAVGGTVQTLAPGANLAALVREAYPAAKKICANIPGFALANVATSPNSDPHLLHDVDLAVLEAALGVAENAAVWLDGQALHQRALPFIAQHLVLVVDSQDLVWNMHEAYGRISLQSPGYGVFVSGPSKTADIEQSLVIGAHGPRSLLVVLRDNA